MAGISWVLRPVVIGDPHLHYRAFGQPHGLPILIDALPVDVPIRNADQRTALATWQRRPSIDTLAEIVSVRIDSEHIHIKRQGQPVRDSEVTCARGDVN